MLEYKTGYAPLPVSIGAAGCLLCLLVLMGLKLKWFRAQMKFDEPAPTQTAYVGVYRSTFSDDVFDFRRPSTLYDTVSAQRSSDPVASTSKARPVSTPTFDKPPASSSKKGNKNTTANGIPVSTVTVVNETKSKDFSAEVNTKVTTGKETGKEGKSASPTEKSGIRFPLFRTKSKEPKAEESLVKEVKVKETKTKEVKVKEQSSKDGNQAKVKATKTKDPAVKVVKPKEPKSKDAKTKTSKPKDAKPKSSKNRPPESQITQNNAFPYVASNSGTPRPPPLPLEGAPLLDDSGYVYMQPTMKTFGSAQPSKGQSNAALTPIPSQETRGLRNPAAMGMSAYKSPKALSESAYDMPSSSGTANRQQFYGMEEESES